MVVSVSLAPRAWRVAVRLSLMLLAAAECGMPQATALDGDGRVETYGVSTARSAAENTSALSAALAAGAPVLRFTASDAPYLVTPIRPKRPVRIEIAPGAVVRLANATCGHNPVFAFEDPKAVRSEISGGGVIDGARQDFAGSCGDWKPEWRWDGVFIDGVPAVTIRDVTIRNVARAGLFISGAASVTLRDLRVEDSGKALVLQHVERASVENINETRIGNAKLPIYQHANEIRGVRNSRLRGIILTDFSPDAAGLEPTPIAFDMAAIGPNVAVSDIFTRGYAGVSPKGGGRSAGLVVHGSTQSTFERLGVADYLIGVEFNAPFFTTIRGVTVDGALAAQPGMTGFGLAVRIGQYAYDDVADSSHDEVGIGAAKATSVTDVIVMRSDVGVFLNGGLRVSGVTALGNRQFGVKIGCETANLSIPRPIPQCADVVIDNVVARHNGYCGVALEGARSAALGGAVDARNNGWRQDLGPRFRAGLCVLPSDQPTRLSLAPNARLGDDQNWSDPKSASYRPGVAADGLYSVTWLNPQKLEVGQWVILRRAAPTGRDIRAQIVRLNEDFSLIRTREGQVSGGGHVDAVTVRVEPNAIFSAEATSEPLGGAFTSKGLNIAGAESALTAQIQGHVWVGTGERWARVSRVRSDGQMQTNVPFVPALAGDALSQLRVDVVGEPSQLYGVSIHPGAQVATALAPFDATGVQAPMLSASPVKAPARKTP
jgi:hypothetical protein